ncbi:hypothetical protein AXK58_15125 [Tsukamurella tyrosinosolvens]|nr:hypothetical protein AXK58_15125 [Tsukamurella tyrosinosolvens]
MESHQDVSGLHVAVRDRFPLVCVVQGGRGTDQHGQGHIEWHGSFGSYQGSRVDPVDVLHREPQTTILGFTAIVQRDDIGMAQAGKEIRLAREACPEVLVPTDGIVEQLEGLLSGQRRVLHQVNGPHTARTQLPNDAISADLRRFPLIHISNRSRGPGATVEFDAP